MIAREPYSYKTDPAVPAFDDSHPIVVIDGTCALCTRGIGFLLYFDRKRKFCIAPIQTEIGRALYTHYGFNPETYDTFLVIAEGKACIKTDGYIETLRQLGGLARFFMIVKIVPRTWRDYVYDIVDRYRIKLFGRTEYCALIPERQAASGAEMIISAT